MGFFGNLFGGAVHLVGSAVRKVGEVTGIKPIEKAGRSIQNAGDRIAGKVGDSSSYHTDTATAQQTRDISAELARFSRDVEEDADLIQSEIEETVRSFFQNLETMVQENHIPLSRRMLQKEHRDALLEIDGFLKDHIAKRVSLSDRECRDILEMDPGSQKTASMRNFTEKVLREGKKKLCQKVEDITTDLFDSFGDAFDEMMDAQEKQLSSKQDALEQLQGSHNLSGQERTRADCQVILNGILLTNRVLEEAK